MYDDLQRPQHRYIEDTGKSRESLLETECEIPLSHRRLMNGQCKVNIIYRKWNE